jgi:hypothetical protein
VARCVWPPGAGGNASTLAGALSGSVTSKVPVKEALPPLTVTIAKQNIAPGTLTLHADRGTSMRSKTVVSCS